MEIKGIFGVEICDGSGKVVKKIENSNTVTNLAIRQVKRWLDREEFINVEADRPKTFGTHIMCAGDMAKICILEDIDITRDTESGDTSLRPIKNMFDIDDNTVYQFWLDRDSWRGQSFRLKEPIHLKGFGFLRSYDSSSYWHGHRIANFGVKLDGCTVSGAGSTDYNSAEYVRGKDLYNGHEYYTTDSRDHFIFVSSDGTKWQMSTSLGGDVAYETVTTELPEHPWNGTWGLVNGSANAPSVTEGNGYFRRPYICLADEFQTPTSDYNSTRQMSFLYRDHQMDDGDPSSDRYIGKYSYTSRTFESVDNLYHEDGYMHPQWYGYIPYVKELETTMYTNGNGDCTQYWYEMDIYKAIPHPQNPYALKLGTDDGTVLPLSESNTDLGSFAENMEWKCDSVEQTTGFTVRYSRSLKPEDANGVVFKEIGLFMNADGHLPHAMSEPRLENATELFARSIFDEPWSKTEDQTATIYYEITVN